ncbi:alpha-2-macroglobulin-like protein 1 [Mixophyes fleayi]|uniref:alpha-2-macroglobulin-like protein 1 n=1 Tax=Mixophyes fleayi TaxID=3061075 RepID=UPI003F4DF245
MCFPNKASLKFSASEASPKDHINLYLESSAGSMCALRAVDKSVQISYEDKELTTESEVGLKILTNTQIMKPRLERLFCPLILHKGMILEPVGVADRIPMEILPEAKSPVSASNDVVRKFFPDTWLWTLILIDNSGTLTTPVTVPDTITQFNARVFCMGDIGFGLSPQVSLTVFKSFFVELSLPYSIVQGETFNLKASVFNYLKQCLKVQVTLLKSPDFTVELCQGCQYSLCVCANQVVTFNWKFTAKRIGLVEITVRAEAVTSQDLCEGKKPYVPLNGKLDIFQKKLLVKPSGIRKEITQNLFSCLKASNNIIYKPFSVKIPTAWVEQSESAYISVMGDILGSTLQNLDQLITMPYGCGEQNMLTMAPIVYVLDYLKSTGQLTLAQKEKAISYLQSGYQKELTYKHSDGSFSAFGESDGIGSTWLTAFVMKCFYQAKYYIYIDEDILKQTVTWLGNQQQSDGCFTSSGKLFHTLMKGGVEDDLSLSAYITSALLEGGAPGIGS